MGKQTQKNNKIKHGIFCNKYKDDGLRKIHKVVSLKCSFVRLCNENFHEWKLIPLRLLKSN